MDPIYVFGHRNPDTDSVVAAIAYTALHHALGEHQYVAARLGHVNDETNFLLDRFGFQAPLYLRSVRTQVRDVDFDVPPTLSAGVPVSYAWGILRQNDNLSGIPVTDDHGKLFGMITAGTIAESDMDAIHHPVVKDVPVFNLLSALEGRIINNDEDVFDTLSGEVVVALPSASGEWTEICQGSIVLCGQQEDVVEHALAVGAACIILCQTNLAEKYGGRSSSTCIIATPCDAYRAARLLYQAIPVSRIAQTKDLVYFHLGDFIDDVREVMLQSRYRSYPVLDGDDQVAGTLSRYHLIRPKRKRVVLLDHNEVSQSVPGLEQAEIMEIIDHHRLADVQTGNPVFVRNEPVGSTNTIVATMFQERGLMPSPALAGLMAGAIISDTIMFKSPTCTPRDRQIAERLARIAGISLEELGQSIFSTDASASKSVEELLNTDFKEFHIAGNDLAISQVTTLDADKILQRMPEILSAMETMKAARKYDMLLLMLTDVLKEGTDLIFVGDEEIIRSAFNTADVSDHHVFLPKVVSRKKQVVPALSLLWG